MSGFRRRRLLPPLLVALMTMTGCATTPTSETLVEPVSSDDARPALGTVPDAVAEDPPVEPAATTSSTAADVLDGIYEEWVPVAIDRLATRTGTEAIVAREVACQDLPAQDCFGLPAELPDGVVRMFDWFQEADGHVPVPIELLRNTAVSCLLLDELTWGEMMVVLRDRGEAATDLSAIAYGAIALMTPIAVVFVCPEHEAAVRDEMTAVVCAELSAEECDQFAATWPVA